jgi:predicted transcriptional regulator
MDTSKPTPYSIRLSQSDRRKLSEIANATTRTPANWVRWAIRQAHCALEGSKGSDDAETTLRAAVAGK